MRDPYKICPVCQQPAVLPMRLCGRCGHLYRTPFEKRMRSARKLLWLLPLAGIALWTNAQRVQPARETPSVLPSESVTPPIIPDTTPQAEVVWQPTSTHGLYIAAVKNLTNVPLEDVVVSMDLPAVVEQNEIVTDKTTITRTAFWGVPLGVTPPYAITIAPGKDEVFYLEVPVLVWPPAIKVTCATGDLRFTQRNLVPSN